ncbi:hypothetical protein EUGRSUZ_B00679 [Eucalyptus grandis]|uniref:Uncharacterized protein n=2 Tax=Eucalyptus grandis TaxID=71139 RepID=A0ACC3LN10_EUCGR|nr:hypothetical protein EUGRSUZ_B00679 [Eucalyptus grandis]
MEKKKWRQQFVQDKVEDFRTLEKFLVYVHAKKGQENSQMLKKFLVRGQSTKAAEIRKMKKNGEATRRSEEAARAGDKRSKFVILY